MSNEKPRIMLVNEQGSCILSDLERSLSCKIDVEYDGRVAAACMDPLNYNVVIIDASDDCIVDGHHSLSEFLKSINPEMIIIGTSVYGRFFNKDELCKQLYDERIAIGMGVNFIEEIKKRLEKYGFEFKDENV
jgi:hypothetical protein